MAPQRRWHIVILMKLYGKRLFFPLTHCFGQKGKVGNSIEITDLLWQRKKDSNPHKRSQSPVCYHYTIPLRTNDIIQIFWDLSTLLPHIFHEMKNTPVGPARTRRQGREKRTQRSRILPSIEIVTTCHGRNFPLARSASRAACSSPPQHGTYMRTMVTL